MRFAIAIVTNADLLVLDEPTVAMDVESRHAFWATMRSSPRGRTVVFATHYLEEADAYADRAVLMARGRVVADGPTTEIKGNGRHAHDPRDVAGADLDGELARLPGVTRVERRGEAVDTRLLRLGRRHPCAPRAFPEARDVEISGAGLEEAFLELTGGEEDEAKAA